jgi:hypothetical protein
MSNSFEIAGVSYPITNLNDLVNSITDATKRAEVLETAKNLVPSDIRYVTEADNSKDPVRTVIASAHLSKHLLLE